MRDSPSRRRTNYSPVRQMSRRFDQDFPPIDSIELQANHSRASTPRPAPQYDPPVPEANLVEEVYVCDCCGISRQLRPSIKFMSTFKSLFFLFNFFAFAFGLANLGMGLWFRIDPKVYEIHKYIETQNFTIAGWLMLFCGFATCLLSLVGFAAATRELSSLLAFYFSIMLGLTLTLVGTLVLLTVYGLGLSLEQFLIKEIYEQIRRRSVNTELNSFVAANAAQFLDFVQVKLRCCGAADFSDYAKLGMVVPTSCLSIDKNFILSPGCGRSLRNLFDLRAGLALATISGSLLSHLIAILLAALMFCSIYHWRAHPRPATPVRHHQLHHQPVDAEPRAQLYQQRPRSRTPIMI